MAVHTLLFAAGTRNTARREKRLRWAGRWLPQPDIVRQKEHIADGVEQRSRGGKQAQQTNEGWAIE